MLRVMTLNINYYEPKHGPWAVRRGLIEEAIRASRADIVALQAVAQDPHLEGGLDQASQLAAATGYAHVVYEPAVTDAETKASKGSAFLSRIAPARIDRHPLVLLPRLEDTNQRTILYGEFSSSVQPVHIFNAHFSWVPEQGQKNVDDALPYFNSYAGPAVMLGDLNATADTPPMQTLASAGWCDAWGRLRPDDPGFTFESSNPSIRIDYVWTGNGLEERLVSIERVAEHPAADGSHASDHFGLVAEIDI